MTVDQDGADSPHPDAFRVLYGAFRALECTTALDPADTDDCASVADEAIRALIGAGLLPEPVDAGDGWGFTGHDESVLAEITAAARLSGMITGTGRYARAILAAGYRRTEQPSPRWELRNVLPELDQPSAVLPPDSGPYYCPESGEVEDPRHGGFDVCCGRPDLHAPMVGRDLALFAGPDQATCGDQHPLGGGGCARPAGHDSHLRQASGGSDAWKHDVDLAEKLHALVQQWKFHPGRAVCAGDLLAALEGRYDPRDQAGNPSEDQIRRWAAEAERGLDIERLQERPARPACPCCGRRVAPLGADDRCGHCGPNRSALNHDGDRPCRAEK